MSDNTPNGTETKRYTNVHVGKGYSVKSKFKQAVTLDDAHAEGKREAAERGGELEYLGVLGVDITQAQLNKRMKERAFG